MTPKRISPRIEHTPPPPPNLTIPRVEADKQLSSRIEIGKGLLASTVRSQDEYEKAKHSYELWHSYNTELLRRIFDSAELSTEYASWGFAVYVESLSDKIKYHFEDVKKYVDRLESIRERLPLYPESSQLSASTLPIPKEQPTQTTKEVFIVHGTDQGVKETVARFLSKLKLEPKILHEQPNLGDTIIEKLEHHSLVAFSVVLLTPDDRGGTNSQDYPLTSRARQNVVFELGYFIGKLGRNKVCALYTEGVELPSDFHGVVYIPFDRDGAWQLRLAKEIKAAGLDIDLNTLC